MRRGWEPIVGATRTLAYAFLSALLVFDVLSVRYGGLALSLAALNLAAGLLIGRWWAVALPLMPAIMVLFTGIPDEPGLVPGEAAHTVRSQDSKGAEFYLLSQLILAGMQGTVILLGVSLRKLVGRWRAGEA